jgi:hypothetical protein
MAISARHKVGETLDFSRNLTRTLMASTTAMCFLLGTPPTLARDIRDIDDRAELKDIGHRGGRFCSATARTLFQACGNGLKDDFFVAKAKCINISNKNERTECLIEAKAAREEGNQTCREQRDGRLAACELLGEGRYEPDFNPARFDDPKQPTNPNPYFPLTVGYTWEYAGGNELNKLEIRNETKLIDGVRCIVFRDQVFKNGQLVENTDDWYVPAKDGNTWYCGEEVKDLESFEGDDPKLPELVKIDGSFKAGRDRDKPGLIFQASPKKGQVYLEEFSLGNAEDVTEILSATYKFGQDPELDQLVPRPLADLFCSAGLCVVTKNYSLLEPGIFARKYYAPGIGFFLEVKPDTQEAVRLVKCNFDSRCDALPAP